MGRDSVYFLAESPAGVTSAVGSSVAAGANVAERRGLLPASTLRLAALEMSTKRMDQEVLRDLFWTLYSKLDAVAQGLRVVYEVSNRIGSVRPYTCKILIEEMVNVILPSRDEISKTLLARNLAPCSL